MNSAIQFDDTERDLLLDILRERMESLHQEIQHTDARAYKEDLKESRTALQKLINKIGAEKEQAAAVG